MKKRKKDMAKLRNVINSLLQGNPLEPKYRDHALSGVWKKKQLRDCHVEPDWVLIYRKDAGELLLFRTGSHSDLGL